MQGCRPGFEANRPHVVQLAEPHLVGEYCLVGDVFPYESIFLDTLLVQGLYVYKRVVGPECSYFKPLLTPFCCQTGVLLYMFGKIHSC